MHSPSRPLPADARAIAAQIAWRVGERRLALVGRLSPLAAEPAREAARFLDRCLRGLAREEARCRLTLGDLLTIFGRRRALSKLGFVRLSDYVRERLGISASEAGVTARVTRRLECLPRVRRAFLEGQLSWTKTRLLAAAAREDTQERWIEIARRHTVRELEILVAQEGALAAHDIAAIREDDGEEVDGEPSARFRMRAPGWVWLLFRRVVDLARCAAGEGGLPLWKAVEAIAAEGVTDDRDPFSEGVEVEMMRRSWRRDRRRPLRRGPSILGSPTEEEDLSAFAPGVAAWLGVEVDHLRIVLPEDVERLCAGAGEASPAEIDRRLRAVVHTILRIDARVGRALRLLAERHLERELGYPHLEAYTIERLGISLRKARSLMALDRAAARSPALGRAYDAGSISWVRAVALLPILREDLHAEAWIDRASQVTVRRLVDEVSWALERRAAGGGCVGLLDPPSLGAPLEPVQMRVDENEAVADHWIEFSGPVSVISMFERLAIAWSHPEEPLWKGLARLLVAVARHWEAEGRRSRDRVIERDRYRCIVPGCSSRRNLQVHHFVFRSAGGGNEAGNLGTICAGHHLRCIHGGTIRARGRAPEAIDWELGVERGRAPLLRLRGDVYATAGR